MIIAVVVAVTMNVSASILRLTLPLTAASTNASAAPNPAASVAVAMPANMVPSTTSIRPKTGSSAPRLVSFSRHVLEPTRGASCGRRIAATKMTTMNDSVIRMPGTIAAM